MLISVALLALVLPAGAQAALPADFWGVVTNEAPNAEKAATLRAGGVESFRAPINWGAVQPEADQGPPGVVVLAGPVRRVVASSGYFLM